MKKIESHREFGKIHKSRNKIYAVIDTEIRNEADIKLHIASVVEITKEEESNKTLLKQKLYSTIADPLYFKAQRGEASEEDWLSAVEKIKSF